MLDYNFHSVKATILGQDWTVTREEIEFHIQHLQESSNAVKHLPHRLQSALRTALENYTPAQILNNQALFERATYGYTHLRSHVRRFLADLDLPERNLLTSNIQDIHEFILNNVQQHILYLPTYRRIEQDIQALFPDFSDEARAQLRSRMRGRRHIELVEFGMEDVETAINGALGKLKDQLRSDLDSLTGEYLREVIRGTHRQADISLVKEVEPAVIDSILKRLDRSFLEVKDQDYLRDMVDRTRIGTPDVKADDQVALHFLSKLIQLYKRQLEREHAVTEYVAICNEYLAPRKKLTFDNQQYELRMISRDEENERPIAFRNLSSGEKQIISLFTHIFLSEHQSMFLMIDEPELSLSVPWQRSLLPNLLKSDRCAGLIAVTHSPFVFENHLDNYAHSIEEFWVAEELCR